MTPEAQRIAIAEACGWKPLGKIRGVFRWQSPRYDFIKEQAHKLPNYLNDLNAMHEAEKVLKGDQRDAYWERLCLTVPLAGDNSLNAWAATAAQRAEAFLRTLGKWKD